jgi:hypothetical protein
MFENKYRTEDVWADILWINVTNGNIRNSYKGSITNITVLTLFIYNIFFIYNFEYFL